MVTQEKIAEELGLSFMTVYRCLSGKGRVSPATRERIMGYIKEHNYHPNLTARSLVLRKSNIVGLLAPSFTYSFYPDIIASIQETLKRHGFNLLLCLSNEDPETEREELDMLLTIPVAGILMSPVNSGKSLENCRRLHADGTPFVLFDRYFPQSELDCPYVATDSFAGSRKIVEYLISLGHRRIAHVGGGEGNSFSKAVLMGYEEALRRNNIALDEALVVQRSPTEGGGYEGMKALLERGVAFSAVQAVNDPAAIGVINASYEAGVKIPGELSLVGFSDISIAGNLSVPLTTIREPTAEIGGKAADILLGLMERKGKRNIPVMQELLTGELVVRQSCASR